MPTATLHLDDVRGYAGPARCYKLSEPKVCEGGVIAEYVTVCLQPRFPHQAPEAAVFAAVESGACAERSMRRQPGSFVLHDDPVTPDKVEGAYAWALAQFGTPLVEA